MRFLVASYPRSGNHLVRGLVEFGFRRPTLGLQAHNDGPISDGAPNRARRVIAIENRDPIGLKVHFLHQLLARKRDFPDAVGMILVTRDPREAITSQLLRHFRRSPWISGRGLRIEIERSISDYLGLLYAYRAWTASCRWHLEFDRLVGEDGSLEYGNQFLERVGAPHRLDAAQWQGLRQVTRESQISLGQIGRHRKPRVRAAVEERLGPEDLRLLMAT